MYPILFSIGPIAVHTSSLFMISGWCIFSFLFWRYLRTFGILEERIFDLTFYGTILGLLLARLGFVFLYPHLFAPSLLLIGAFWIQPGVWLYGGLLGMGIIFYLLSKRYHLQFSLILDAWIVALWWSCIPIVLGILFQGGEVGKVTTLPWAIRLPAEDGLRHPMQLYEILALLCIGLISIILAKLSKKHAWNPGLLGIVLIVVATPVFFLLEFMKDRQIYLYGISVNQWVLIGLFAESTGSLIIKGHVIRKLKTFVGGIHERTRTKHTHHSQGEAPRGEKHADEENTGT